MVELRVGMRVRCKRTGQIGTVQAINEVRIGDTWLPDMLFIKTSETGGIVRDPASIEPMGGYDA